MWPDWFGLHKDASDSNVKHSVCYPRCPGETRAGPKATGLEKGEVDWKSIFMINLAEVNVLNVEQEGKRRTSDCKLNVWVDMFSRIFH